MYEIGGDHERHFTDDGIIKLADIQPGQLLDLVQAVDQGIAVEIEISGALCNAKTRVQKGMDGVQGLIINIRQVEPVEMIVQIFFTGLDRQLIDQFAKPQILRPVDVLRIGENIADLHSGGDIEKNIRQLV